VEKQMLCLILTGCDIVAFAQKMTATTLSRVSFNFFVTKHHPERRRTLAGISYASFNK